MLTKNLKTTVLGFIGALLVYLNAKGLVDRDLLTLLNSSFAILAGISAKDSDS